MIAHSSPWTKLDLFTHGASDYEIFIVFRSSPPVNCRSTTALIGGLFADHGIVFWQALEMTWREGCPELHPPDSALRMGAREILTHIPTQQLGISVASDDGGIAFHQQNYSSAYIEHLEGASSRAFVWA